MKYPGETVMAEAGALNWMEDGIAFEAIMGEGCVLGSFDRMLDRN